MEIIVIVRIGNLLVPNNNYVKFEEWLMPILDKLLEEQNKNGVVWTPSKIIHRLLEASFWRLFGQRILDFCDRLGLEIKDESSIYYWAAKWAQWNIGPHTTATIYCLAIAGTTSQWFLPLWRMEVLETCSSFTPLKIQVPFLSYVWGHWQYSTFRLGGRHPWGPKTYQQAGNEKRQHRFHQFDLSLDSTAVAAHN